ncbi:non-repetitive/WGA-negative nucleoporin [Xylaria flabelliformis]|nr:non-repetitive/WGA-negative nucleoporin [Xylaria flabelliformis]KAI0854707.1 Non-repetitive/WGA-negative nucleoporin C-terminal-domain-containing protein [Xylaria cubensis]
MSFPQTPAHALPGAFLNTPAVASRFNAQQDPVRRVLFPPAPAPPAGQPVQDDPLAAFGNDNGILRPLQPAAPPQPPLAKAAGFINNVLARDEHYPELDRYCRQISSDYDMADFNSAWAPFQRAHHFEIPQAVFEHYDRAQVSTTMGLFAEINHAWVAIDNCLYLWDYTHPNPELIGYEDNQYSITAVKLVPPKPGVFNSVIKHILAVATAGEMFLLGLGVNQGPTGANNIELYGTKMSLHYKGDTHIIAGSATGRIFFTNRSDCDIHELYYQQEEKWFSSRVGKINHSYPGWGAVIPSSVSLWGNSHAEHIVDIVVDDSRNLLYSLSNGSTVRTYYMEAPDKLTKVIEKTKNDFLRDIAHALSVVSPLLTERMEIVSISPVSATEDNKVHLMALTSTGCRLFMSATSASSYMVSASSRAPQSMQLQSIKFPPVESNQRRVRADPFNGLGEPTSLQSRSLEPSRRGIRFPPGYFLDFVSKADRPDVDVLFMSAPDSGRIKNASRSQTVRYYEQANWVELDSKAEDIGLVTKPFAATNQPLGFGNELAVQFDNTDGTDFVILTNTGVHIMRRRRLVDIFASVIRSTTGDEGLKTEVNRFQGAYGRVETITAALAVACRQGDNGQFGVTGRSATDQATLDRAKQVFINFGGSPTLPEQDGQPATAEQVRPSSRHAAITLYLGRLIRSLWRSKVVSVGSNGAGALAVNSVIPQTKLREVQDAVITLRNFLNENRSFIQGLSGPSELRRAASKQEELALQGEHQAMHAVEILMTDITEGISFVMTLFEERVTDIYARLDEVSQQGLKDLTYERLFSQIPGKQLAKVLVKAIVNRNIENGSNVETVADALRRRCGSFCSADDVVIFKAQEQLKRASEPSLNPNMSRTLLHESLRHFQKVAAGLTQANLESAIQQYIELRYYAGAIQLCLSVADARDRGRAALYWVNDGKPANDPRARAFEQRRLCYDLVHRVLLDLDTASSREPEMVDNKPTLIATKRAEAYDVVSSSTDEVFHVDLYDWYIQQGWTERLLAIESPYVTTFLRRLATQDVAHAELLCRFYTMRSMYFNAAKVQSNLAKSDFALTIKERLHLLSKAKTNASVMTPGVSRQEQQLLNHEVTELLDVANVQDDLLERLKSDARIPPDRKVEIQNALDGQILPVSELFNIYADPAGYYDLCLIMYHVADFRNPTTIAQTWTTLIQQTHQEVLEQLATYDAERRRQGAAAGDPPPRPYETLVARIEGICHRSSKDSSIFPVTSLMPEVCRYAVEQGQDGRIGADVHWPINLFIHLDVSHDLVVRVLESMFATQNVPFRGAGRARLVEWISHAVSQWVRELGRHGRPDAKLEPWVGELMAECDTWATANVRGTNEGGADPRDLAREVREVRRAVENLIVAPVGARSMGFY